MKRIIISICFLISLITTSEVIENLNINVSLNKDGSVHILKEIDFNPQGKDLHGISLKIVKKNFHKRLFKYDDKVGLKNFSSNIEAKYLEDAYYDTVRLGDENTYLDKDLSHKFIIEYDIYNILKNKDDENQIYLNVIGNEWDMPIYNYNINIDMDMKYINKLDVFTGRYNEIGNNYVINNNKISNKFPLDMYEGVTFRLNFSDKLYKHTTKNKIINIFNTYNTLKLNIVLIILSLLLLIYTIQKKISFNLSKPVIYPNSKIDENISPALCHKVYAKSKHNMLTVIFLSLVSKGIITSSDNKKYNIKEDESVELSEEEIIVKDIFLKNPEDILKSPSIVNEAFTKSSIVVRNIFRKNVGHYIIFPKIVNIVFVALCLICSTLLSEFDILTLSIVIILNLIIFVISNILVLKESGRKIYQSVFNYLMFFDAVEKNVFNTLADKESIIAYARKNLPYAVALGIEAKFLDKLNKVLDYRNIDRTEIYPYIYYDYFIASRMINNSINRAMMANKATKGNNFNSGGGGFSSGGGFSGGGYSGGGGSSW